MESTRVTVSETPYFGQHSGLMDTFGVLQAVNVLFVYNSKGVG